MRADERVVALHVLNRHVKEALQHVGACEEQLGCFGRNDLKHLDGHASDLLLRSIHQLHDILEFEKLLDDVDLLIFRAVVNQDAQGAESCILVGPVREAKLVVRVFAEDVVSFVFYYQAHFHSEQLTSIGHSVDLIIDRVGQVVSVVNQILAREPLQNEIHQVVTVLFDVADRFIAAQPSALLLAESAPELK